MENTKLIIIKWNKIVYDEYDNNNRLVTKSDLRIKQFTLKSKFHNRLSKYPYSKIVKYEWNTTWRDFI